MPRTEIKLITNPLMIADVPRVYLRGTQPLTEYRPESRERVERALREQGIQFLRDNLPQIIIVPVRNRDQTDLFIHDGHHRIRYPKVEVIPTAIYSVEDAAAELNISVDDLTQELIDSGNYAESTFIDSYHSVEKTYPRRVSLAVNYDQLVQSPEKATAVDGRFIITRTRSAV